MRGWAYGLWIWMRLVLTLQLSMCAERQVAVRGVIPGIEAAKLYRGRGGELMRTAVCHLAHSLAVVGMALTPAERDGLLATLEDHLSQALPNVQVSFPDDDTWQDRTPTPGHTHT